MNKITEKKDFQISPQRRGVDENLMVATPTNAKNIYEALVENVEVPNCTFFRNYVGQLTACRDALQELYGISSRTYQYWSNESNLKPKINHHAVVLLSLNAHPDLEVVSR